MQAEYWSGGLPRHKRRIDGLNGSLLCNSLSEGSASRPGFAPESPLRFLEMEPRVFASLDPGLMACCPSGTLRTQALPRGRTIIVMKSRPHFAPFAFRAAEGCGSLCGKELGDFCGGGGAGSAKLMDDQAGGGHG